MRNFALIGKVSSLCGYLQRAIVIAMEVSVKPAVLLSVAKLLSRIVVHATPSDGYWMYDTVL